MRRGKIKRGRERGRKEERRSKGRKRGGRGKIISESKERLTHRASWLRLHLASKTASPWVSPILLCSCFVLQVVQDLSCGHVSPRGAFKVWMS